MDISTEIVTEQSLKVANYLVGGWWFFTDPCLESMFFDVYNIEHILIACTDVFRVSVW